MGVNVFLESIGYGKVGSKLYPYLTEIIEGKRQLIYPKGVTFNLYLDGDEWYLDNPPKVIYSDPPTNSKVMTTLSEDSFDYLLTYNQAYLDMLEVRFNPVRPFWFRLQESVRLANMSLSPARLIRMTPRDHINLDEVPEADFIQIKDILRENPNFVIQRGPTLYFSIKEGIISIPSYEQTAHYYPFSAKEPNVEITTNETFTPYLRAWESQVGVDK